MSTQTLKAVIAAKNDNPFYGLRSCLELYQNASKNVTPSTRLLDAAWAEVKDDKTKREMFFSLLFSIGDITGRHHNMFGKDRVDNGGGASREAFRFILEWIRNKNYEQFVRFMFRRMITEYTSYDNLFATRVQTKKKTSTVIQVIDMITSDEKYQDDLAEFVSKVYQGKNPVDKYFISKFLTRPRLSKRAGHKKLLPQTKEVMLNRQALLKKISDRCGFEYIEKGTHIEFKGYYEWRKEYNGDLESVLFSSKKILEFDKQEFLQLLEKLPAGARYRVRCRLLESNNSVKTTKWNQLPQWFLEFEAFKSQKQAEQRVLEEKVRQGTATDDQKFELEKVKKEAKVTTGAVNFADFYSQIVTGNVDMLKIQPFLDKIKLDYNTLVFMDDSGSMFQGRHNKYGFTPAEFAVFMATICLSKNPDDDARSLVGLFSSRTRLFSHINARVDIPNSLFNRGQVRTVNEPFIDPSKHFVANLQRMKEFLLANYKGQMTNISSIPAGLAEAIGDNPVLKEQLMNYPIWTIISDGNFNTLGSPEASINDMLKQAEKLLGFKPFIIAIDVANYTSASAERFSGIENFMFVSPNPNQIEQLLTNFKDMDVMDVYTPLLNLYRSNRYAPVRKETI